MKLQVKITLVKCLSVQFALMEGYKLYLSLFRININYTFFYSANPINTSILKIN